MHSKSFLFSVLVVLIGCGDDVELSPEQTCPALSPAVVAASPAPVSPPQLEAASPDPGGTEKPCECQRCCKP